MKSLFKSSTSVALSLFVCSASAHAADFTRSVQSQSHTSSDFQQTTGQNFASKSPLISSNSKNLSAHSAIATMLPVDTPLVASVSTKSEVWTTLGRFHLLNRTWQQISQYISPTIDFDYARDVESWLGEQVILAFLPKQSSSPATVESSFIMLAPVKNETDVQPFLDKILVNTKGVTQKQYKGITILEVESQTTTTPPSPAPKAKNLPIQKLQRKNGFAIAVMPGYVALSYTAKPIEQVIDSTEESRTTLAQNPQFQKTSKNLTNGNVLFSMYQNAKTFPAFIEDIAKDPNLILPLPGIDSFKSGQINSIYDSINTYITVEPQGLRLQIIAALAQPKSDTISSTTQSKSDVAISTIKTKKILALMPAATYSAVTGHNLNQQWQNIVKVLDVRSESKEKLTQFRQSIRSNTGLDVDRDIMSWMDGEYAFFLFPTKNSLLKTISPNFNLGAGLAIQTSNQAAAKNTLQKLEQFIASFSKGSVVVNRKNIKGQSVTSWDVKGKSSQSLLAYSWSDNNTLIVTTGFEAMTDLVPQPYVKLSNTYNFTTATSSLPQPNQGYFYMNMGALLSWAYSFLPPQFQNQNFLVFQEMVGSIYSISGTSSATDDREQIDVLVVLAPNRQAKK